MCITGSCWRWELGTNIYFFLLCQFGQIQDILIVVWFFTLSWLFSFCGLTFLPEILVLNLAVIKILKNKKSGRSPNCMHRTDVKGGLKCMSTDPWVYRNFVSISFFVLPSCKRGKTQDSLWTFQWARHIFHIYYIFLKWSQLKEFITSLSKKNLD